MNGSKKLRGAIIGCGGIAQVHGAVLQGLETAELAACADVVPQRAQDLAGKFGGHAYDSLQALLEQEPVDVVHLCTPHYLHTPMAQLAASRGIHVFTEKPPVISREQWGEFSNLETAKGVRVGICFQNRYNPSVRLLEGLLGSGRTGKPLGARAFVTWRREAPYYTESGWRGRWGTEGGGVLINQSIHTLDLLVRFLGKPIGVEATMANHHLKGTIEVEDTLEASIDFGGKRALFYATTAHCTDSPVLIELVCERCTLRIEEPDVTIRWENGDIERRTMAPAGGMALGKSYWGSSHALCIGDFYRCVLENAPFQNDIPSVADTMDLMLSIYEASRGTF